MNDEVKALLAHFAFANQCYIKDITAYCIFGLVRQFQPKRLRDHKVRLVSQYIVIPPLRSTSCGKDDKVIDK